MSSVTSLQFRRPPVVMGQYLRALLARGTPSGRNRFPAVEAHLNNLLPVAEKVNRYAVICGFDSDSDILPCTFPHIMAFPLHMELMLHKDFPLPLMGLVHVRNSITQYRQIGTGEHLDISCQIAGSRDTEKGTEFDIGTAVRSNTELVWESVSTNFFRQKKNSAENKQPFKAQPKESFDYSEHWQLPSDLGRRYARISGDSNPIHLFPFSARLFGFKRHIAHGMWSKARIAASLTPAVTAGAFRLSCEFRQPVFLPASANLHYRRLINSSKTGFDFELRNQRGDKTHVRGRAEMI